MEEARGSIGCTLATCRPRNWRRWQHNVLVFFSSSDGDRNDASAAGIEQCASSRNFKARAVCRMRSDRALASV